MPIYCVARDDRVCAVTVDATWGDDKTMALLDLFDRHGLKVTFFLAGHWIKSYPDKVREIASRGHELGNHSWTHPHMSALSRDKIRDELERTQQAIADLVGKRPAVFRPPFGDYSNTVITVAQECGLRTIQWSVDSLDWKDLSAAQIRERVMKRVRPGAIILFHNAGKNSVEALDWIIRDLKTDGYVMLPVSELLLDGETYIDRSTGEQRSVGQNACTCRAYARRRIADRRWTRRGHCKSGAGRAGRRGHDHRDGQAADCDTRDGGHHSPGCVCVRGDEYAQVETDDDRREAGCDLSGVAVGGLFADEVRQVVLGLAPASSGCPEAIYHSETGEVVPEEPGVAVDVDRTVIAVMAAPRASVEVTTKQVPPQVTAAMLAPVRVATSERAVALAFNVAWGEEWLPRSWTGSQRRACIARSSSPALGRGSSLNWSGSRVRRA